MCELPLRIYWEKGKQKRVTEVELGADEEDEVEQQRKELAYVEAIGFTNEKEPQTSDSL